MGDDGKLRPDEIGRKVTEEIMTPRAQNLGKTLDNIRSAGLYGLGGIEAVCVGKLRKQDKPKLAIVKKTSRPRLNSPRKG
jgi:hypothetical protein